MQQLKTVTEEEFQRILRRIRFEANTQQQQRIADRDTCILLLCFDAGLRIGEVLALTWEMLYINAVPVSSLTLPPRFCKTGFGRTVPLTSRVKDSLSRWLGRCGIPPSEHPTDPVFSAAGSGKQLTARTIQIMLNKASKQQLGRCITPHQLRHSFASRMMRVTDMRTVQMLLGHCSLRSTQIYTHPDSQDLQNAIGKLEAADAAPDRKPK